MIDGKSAEGTPSASGTAVRFDVSDTASLDDVDEVRLVRWRVAMPFHHVFEMPLVSGETMALPDGASVTVRHVLEQKSGTIVQFDGAQSMGTEDLFWNAARLASKGLAEPFQGGREEAIE